MLAPAVAAIAVPTTGAVLAEAAGNASVAWGAVGSAIVATLGVVLWLMGKIHPDSTLRRERADRSAERVLFNAELEAERADRKEAQKAVNDWLPLMTRTATAMETVAQYLQTEVHLRGGHDHHPGGE